MGSSAADRFQMLGELTHAVSRTHELQQFISRQRAHIQGLRRGGHDTVNEELVLAQLEESHTRYETDSARLESELGKLPTSETRLRCECRRSGH